MIYEPYRIAYMKNDFFLSRELHGILCSFPRASSDSINNHQAEREGCFHVNLSETETKIFLNQEREVGL